MKGYSPMLKLKVKDIISIHSALSRLDGVNHLLKKGSAEEVHWIPFQFDHKVRWNIVKNARIFKELWEDFSAVNDGIIKEISGGHSGIDEEDKEKVDKYNLAYEKLANETKEIEGTLRLKLADLNIEVNPIPASILVALSPLIDE